MSNKEIGTVVSTLDGPSPSFLDFVVNEGTIHRGQFVEMDYSEGTMIALVQDVIKTNRYFERAEAVKEFESSGRKLFEQFPTTEWEYLLAKTRPMGVYSKGMIKRSSFPPSPGTRVRIASAENLKKFLGFDEDGLHLGEVEYHSLPVKLNMTKLLSKHLAVLAMSGAGKSVATRVMMEELLTREKEKGRMAIVVMDTHGEYTSFAEPVTDKEHKDYSSKTKVIKARDIKIGVPKLTIGILSGMIPGLSAAQRRDLGRILERMKKEMKDGLGPFDLGALRTELAKDSELKDNTRKALMGWIATLDQLKLFSKIDSPSISDLIKPGQLTIVDLSDLINMKKKQMIVSYFAQKLFYERRNHKIPPFLLVLEEAHQLVPEGTSKEGAISRPIIETIAREGRKFNASLCLISQRPIQLSTTALSQCNTHLILRVTNPYDLDHIGKGSEGLDRRSLDMITSLRVGEGLLVGEAVNYPVFFKVRKNNSLESKHEIPLEEAAINFEKKKEEIREEAEEFL
ncbi:MAG: ATP-binding protein [Candidatus Diapherotrites archaeon]